MTAYLITATKGYLANYQGLSKKCWLGINLNFIESILGGAFYFLSTYFVKVLHLDVHVAGLIISLYGVGAIIGGVIGGKLSDNISPLLVSGVSLITQASSFIILAHFTQVNILGVAVLILGIATYGFITSNYVWVLRQCQNSQKEKLQALNILSSISNLGLSLSAIIISIFTVDGFKNIFIIFGFVLFAMAAYVMAYNRNSPLYVSSRNQTDDSGNSAPATHCNASSGDSKLWMTVLLCVFLVGCVVSQVGTTYSLYLQAAFPEHGVKGFSSVFVMNSLMMVLLQAPLVGFFSNRNKILMLGVGGFLVGFGMFLLCFSFTFTLVYLACIIYTVGEMIFFSMAQLFCYEHATETNKGHSLGMYRMTYAASRVAGPAIGGFVYFHFDGVVVWCLCGVVGLFCLLACIGTKCIKGVSY